MLNTVYSLQNLEKAWGWIKSNPDKMYKGYFRTSYRNHEVVKDEFLYHISQQLRNGTFQPSTACKVFFPKPSGILRPYTLLTVADQVVYQAFCNVIAEQLLPLVSTRYNKKIFGHQYAGQESPWFYNKWSDGYKRYNKAAEKVFNEGKIYSASFDLTACYDSIDHGVLTHYLKTLGFSEDFCSQLCSYLTVWTATNHEELIYQNHGIPQGPLSSGILSEIVLKAFDDERRISGVSYMRYVDDIRLFADNEESLRSELVRLDSVSKKIGLFPQSSKIGIHKIENIFDELKNLSHPGSFLPRTNLSQAEILSEITKASFEYEIVNISRLKYFVAVSRTNNKLEERLWKLYDKYPHLYATLCGFLKKYSKLTNNSYKKVLKELEKNTPYQAIHAEFISVLSTTNLDDARKKECVSLVKRKFYGSGKNLIDSDTSLLNQVSVFLINHGALTKQQIRFLSSCPRWYPQFCIAGALGLTNNDVMPEMLIEFIKNQNEDVALAGANGAIVKRLAIPNHRVPNHLSAPFLNTYGKQGIAEDICLIDRELRRMFKLGNRFPRVDWATLLDSEYNLALEIIISCRGNYSLSAAGWLLDMDSFNDVVIRRHFILNGNIGALAGNYGAAFHNNRFRTTHPRLHDNAEAIHNRRLTTVTAHAYGKTQNQNTVFKHGEKHIFASHQLNILFELAQLYPVN